MHEAVAQGWLEALAPRTHPNSVCEPRLPVFAARYKQQTYPMLTLRWRSLYRGGQRQAVSHLWPSSGERSDGILTKRDRAPKFRVLYKKVCQNPKVTYGLSMCSFKWRLT